MKIIDRVHGDYVFSRRIRVLAEHLATLLPPQARALDVGCGDGALASLIMRRRPDVEVCGLDVLVRQQRQIPVKPFDGRTIPYDDGSFDVVMFVDVLHHTDDPMILLREAVRVARQAVVLKDHTRDGLLAGPILKLMDYVGNARYGVSLPYNYWSWREWQSAFSQLNIRQANCQRNLGLYPAPASWFFDRSLHFVARLDLTHPTE